MIFVAKWPILDTLLTRSELKEQAIQEYSQVAHWIGRRIIGRPIFSFPIEKDGPYPKISAEVERV